MLKNPRHEKFAQIIAAGASASDAYRKAGYSANGANVSGPKLLAKPRISSRVAQLRKEMGEKCQIGRKEFSDRLADCFAGKLELRPDQLKAGEMLAKACGWNEPEKVELSGKQEIIIEIGGNTNPN